jgi:hypothetical protein
MAEARLTNRREQRRMHIREEQREWRKAIRKVLADAERDGHITYLGNGSYRVTQLGFNYVSAALEAAESTSRKPS